MTNIDYYIENEMNNYLNEIEENNIKYENIIEELEDKFIDEYKVELNLLKSAISSEKIVGRKEELQEIYDTILESFTKIEKIEGFIIDSKDIDFIILKHLK